jgi:hypothetical protein
MIVVHGFASVSTPGWDEAGATLRCVASWRCLEGALTKSPRPARDPGDGVL